MHFFEKSKLDRNIFIYLLLAVFSTLSLIYCMQMDPWANSDTALYFNLAHNIAEGNGFVTNYPSGRLSFAGLNPPLYSMSLAVLDLLNLSLIEGVIVGNVLICSVILIGCSIWAGRLTHNWLASLLVPLCLFLNLDFFTAFTGAMSEPLYLLLMLASLVTLLKGIAARQGGMPWLIFSAILAGLAAFTRFIGVSSILLGCAAILIFMHIRPLKKWLYSFLYGAIGAIPLGYWFFIKSRSYSTDVNRSFVIPEDFIHRCAVFLYGVYDTILKWIPPANLIPDIRPRRVVVLVICSVILGFFIALNFKHYRALWVKHDSRLVVLLVLLLFVISYTFILFASSVFSSIPPDIYGRTLLPLLPGFLLILAILLGISFDGFGNRKSVFTFAILLAFVAGYLPASAKNTFDWATNRHNMEEGYLQAKYVHSELLEVIRNLPSESRLISNQDAVILLHTNKYPYGFPEFNCESIRARKGIPFGSGETADDRRYRDGLLLAMFNDDVARLFIDCLPENWIASRNIFFSQSIPIVVTSDGTIYRYDLNTAKP